MTNLFNRFLTTLISAGLAAMLGLSVTAHAGTASGGGATVTGIGEDPDGEDGPETGPPISFSSDPVTYTMESETAAPLLFGPTEMPALEEDESFFHYYIMSRSNGEDTYTLSSLPGTLDNVDDPGTVTFLVDDVAITEVTLGGTVASATSALAATTIAVPDDDDLTDNVSHGIATGDRVIIDGEGYQVTNVTEDPAGNEITVDPALVGEVTEGTPIAEITDFDVSLAGIGSIIDPAAPVAPGAHSGEIIDTTITATSSDGKAESVSLTSQIYAIIESASTTYVRNTDTAKNPADPADADYTSASGELFYSSGDVTAAAGDILEYAIVAEAGTGNSTGVSFSVTIPSSTPYVLGSTRLNNADPAVTDVGDASALEGGMEACDLVSCMLGAADPTSPLNSTLAWGGTAEATFQVELASTLVDPTTYEAPAEPALVAWTGDPADAACWDEGLTPAAGWASGECMFGEDAQAYCNTYAQLEADGTFSYADANSTLAVLLSCE